MPHQDCFFSSFDPFVFAQRQLSLSFSVARCLSCLLCTCGRSSKKLTNLGIITSWIISSLTKKKKNYQLFFIDMQGNPRHSNRLIKLIRSYSKILFVVNKIRDMFKIIFKIQQGSYRNKSMRYDIFDKYPHSKISQHHECNLLKISFDLLETSINTANY